VQKQKEIEKTVETQKKKVKKVIKKMKINKARRERSHCPHNGRVRKSVNVLGST
jgi:hypothetical protein